MPNMATKPPTSCDCQGCSQHPEYIEYVSRNFSESRGSNQYLHHQFSSGYDLPTIGWRLYHQFGIVETQAKSWDVYHRLKTWGRSSNPMQKHPCQANPASSTEKSLEPSLWCSCWDCQVNLLWGTWILQILQIFQFAGWRVKKDEIKNQCIWHPA